MRKYDSVKARTLRTLVRMGARLCDECGRSLSDEFEEDDELKFCSAKDKWPRREWLTCKKAYYIFDRESWDGPQFSWLVEK